jgi:hypothetical protein
MAIALGDRVHWFRAGAPFGGYLTGYVTAIYDSHGDTKLRVRSNGSTYTVRPKDLLNEETK